MNKTNIPNFLSFVRIILSIILLFLVDYKVFYFVYILTLITDFLDGYIARKSGKTSLFGARLDSLGDVFLFILIIYFVYLKMDNYLYNYILVFIILFIIKAISIIILFIKFKKILIIHTIGNKILGIIIYLIPFIYLIIKDYYLITIFFISFIVIIEELLISLYIKKLNIDEKSIYSLLKRRE